MSNAARNLTSSPLKEIELYIQVGKLEEARKALEEVMAQRVRREDCAPVANLSWRAGVPLNGLRILAKYIRPRLHAHEVPTAEEKVQYAACLIRIGATEEAQGLLRAVPQKESIETLLYQSFILASQWEYAKAVPLLVEYTKLTPVHSYQRLIGKANLAAALVYERRYLDATVLLRELLHETSVKKLNYLLGITLELSAANFTLQRKWGESEKFLKKAEQLLNDTHCLDGFFTRKWRALQGFLQHPKNKLHCTALEKIRKEAKARSHWETLRDLDRYETLAKKDVNLLAHLYYGTPYPAFRKKLLEDFGVEATVPKTYLWNFEKGTGKGVIVDIAQGKSDAPGKKEVYLKSGMLIHRLLMALTSDFYRPLRIATAFSRLFPDEFYNPDTAPHRVHEAHRRLREWFEEGSIPLSIEEEKGHYRIVPEKTCYALLSIEPTLKVRYQEEIKLLSKKFGQTPFSLGEAAKALSTSSRSALRIVGEAIKSGFAQRSGKGMNTKYQFTA